MFETLLPQVTDDSPLLILYTKFRRKTVKISPDEYKGYPRAVEFNVHENSYMPFKNAGRIQFSLAP